MQIESSSIRKSPENDAEKRYLTNAVRKWLHFLFYEKYFLYICTASERLKILVMDLNKNFELFLKKLEEIGVPTEKLVENYGEKVKFASFSVSSEYGLAFEGSLIYVLLYKLTPYAIKINELYPEDVRVDKNSLIKVCLLHQIGKAIRIVENNNEWEVKNRKLPFKYVDGLPAIRTGLQSLSMACRCGIEFSDVEVEAMTVNDRELSDNQARFHAGIMSSIVRQASEMVYTEVSSKK